MGWVLGLEEDLVQGLVLARTVLALEQAAVLVPEQRVPVLGQ